MLNNSIKITVKIFLLTLFLVGVFLPAVTWAEYDNRNCWSGDECTKIGKGIWEQNENCGSNSLGEDLGECYKKKEPIDLQVSIPTQGSGVKNQVSDFPEYLGYIYSFFVMAIGVVAVAYIAFGGYQWIIAAGSPEKISQAKNTIQGALIGLLLAAGSYVILNLINERLSNFEDLKLPMIKPEYLAGFCDTLPGNVKLSKTTGEVSYIYNKDEADCGVKYFIEGEGDNTCIGGSCYDILCANGDPPSAGGVCADGSTPSVASCLWNSSEYKCQSPIAACENITDDIVDNYGPPSEPHHVYESVCNKNSDGVVDYDACTWVEYAGHFNTDDKCEWYTLEEQAALCEGKTKCSDFQGLFQAGSTVLTGIDWAACHKDWCNLGCKPFWSDWDQDWECCPASGCEN